jgi:Zn-dependent M28 family amino/carboxypeptidase
MTIQLEGRFSPGPVLAPLIVGEIPGLISPAQRVVIEAHLDSWDLAEGVLDDGVGVAAVLEAARSLRALNLRPNRTLVFVLSSGEEQHHFGIKTYLDNHAAELMDTEAVLVLDGGTGPVTNISLQNLRETEPVFRKIYDPIAKLLHLHDLTSEEYSGSDGDQFLTAGVPAFICIQATAHYDEAHHSQADTLRYFDSRGATQAAKVLAMWIWNTSQVEDRIPHSMRD